jgi:hypothetical protein
MFVERGRGSAGGFIHFHHVKLVVLGRDNSGMKKEAQAAGERRQTTPTLRM